jgi:hypothetical protein
LEGLVEGPARRVVEPGRGRGDEPGEIPTASAVAHPAGALLHMQIRVSTIVELSK